MKRANTLLVVTLVIALLAACAAAQAQPAALVTRDPAALRAAPSVGAPVLATLWRGELLEVRGERGDYVQVWDYQRERGGYVARSLLQRIASERGDVPALLALLGFVSEQPQSESLGLALAAATIQALSAEQLQGAAGAQVLDAIGRQAERLAERAATPSPRAADHGALSAHLDVAARYGVHFVSRANEALTDAPSAPADSVAVRLCYDGDAWRRLLLHPAASAEQRARAALALTRSECDAPGLKPAEREAADLQRFETLQHAGKAIDASSPSTPATPGTADATLHQRVLMRRAGIEASLAYAAARRGDEPAARRWAGQAIADLARVPHAELLDDDTARYAEAALRVNAVRWAAAMAPATVSTSLAVSTTKGDDGQTCVVLSDPRWKDGRVLARRCTWGIVWLASASVSREGQALALAVQPADGWRELWVFSRQGRDWAVQVLPPAPANPGVGYAEFAGWVPGGRQLLAAREAIAEGRSLRRFEVLRLDGLVAERQNSDPTQLGAFNRWSDAAWKRETLALR